ncbi:MAG: glycosyltransferase 87 family protein [Candidatus Sulfotelmatobacter sp.]
MSLFAATIATLYSAKVLGPWDKHWGEVHDGIKVQMGDLYSPWDGARELLLRRRNPYGAEVSHEIQSVFYGHAIRQTYRDSLPVVTNEQRFAYPIYVVFLLAPTVYADFENIVRPWAEFAFGILTVISVLLCFNILHWRPPWETVIAVSLLTLSSPQIVQGLRFQQLALVVGFLLIASAWCVSRNHLAAAGALLAVSTIKPQMALLPFCWFAIWAAGEWPKRWRLPAFFVATMAVLVAAGELLLHGWMGYFLAGLAAYRRYALPTSTLGMALGDTLGEIVGGILILGLLAFAWRNRKEAGDSRQLTALLAAFFMGDLLALPLFTPFNQVLLILPVMLLLQDWETLRRFSKLVFVICISWPWVVSTVLLLFRPHVDSPSQLPLLPSFLVPFMPLVLPLLLRTRRRQPTDLPARDLSPG